MLCKTNQHKKLKQHEKLTNVLETDFKKISIGNSMICSDIWHKYHE